VTLKALELGAIDFVAKPKIGIADGLKQLGEEITDKIRIAAKAHIKRLAQPALPGPRQRVARWPPWRRWHPRRWPGHGAPGPSSGLGRISTEKIIFIGASTGGTEATKEVLLGLPPDAPAVVITQHMPPGFTRSYAARLDGLCRIRVKEAVDGERILPGHAYIAPGGCT
jgi:two-component system chemotaxis response regulator CheB